MSLTVTCALCAGELDEPGGLLFSPPGFDDVLDLCVKYHICAQCFEAVADHVLENQSPDFAAFLDRERRGELGTILDAKPDMTGRIGFTAGAYAQGWAHAMAHVARAVAA